MVSFSWVKKAPFCLATLIPPQISAKISTSYTPSALGWLSGEQGDSFDWAKRHLLNAKLMDRAMKADWRKRRDGKADFSCWPIEMDGDDKKAQHVNMFYIFGSKMTHKRIVLMFYFFLWWPQKMESGCLPPCCWYSPTIHFSSFWSETSVGCILLQSHFFAPRILKYWDSCHSKGGFCVFFDPNEFTLQVKQQLGMYLSKRLGSRSEKMAHGNL